MGAEPATVLYEDRVVRLDGAPPDSSADLWVTPADLTRINGFELKPEGACRGELCIPVGKEMSRQGRFNATAFARKTGRAYAADAGVWSFAEIPELRRNQMQSGVAPDFALPDRAGKLVRLSDFRGKKVLLLTWASW